MAVLLETSKGDLVIDLFVEEAPTAAQNFLKLCKVKYYNNCLFHNVQRNFIVQTGDPTGSGTGGTSIYGVLYGEQARFFQDEIHQQLKHRKLGTVAMANAGENLNASQFYITTAKELDSLDGKHTIFGEVSEGLDVLAAINEVASDERGRPIQNVRIRHTIILEDPFPDPPQLVEHIPDASPEPLFGQDGRLEEDWQGEDTAHLPEEVHEAERVKDAGNRAVVLEMIGDLPEADAKPPSDMLFICKLNPVTTEEDLEIIFSRFGTVTSCDIIRDHKTGDSLCYAFLGFDNEKSCEDAYFKMNNVLIDDRRVKVDFSQSVYHLWKQYRRFGKAGSKEEGELANDHERGSKRAQPPSSQLRGGDLLTGAGTGRHERGHEYSLLLGVPVEGTISDYKRQTVSAQQRLTLSDRGGGHKSHTASARHQHVSGEYAHRQSGSKGASRGADSGAAAQAEKDTHVQQRSLRQTSRSSRILPAETQSDKSSRHRDAGQDRTAVHKHAVPHSHKRPRSRSRGRELQRRRSHSGERHYRRSHSR